MQEAKRKPLKARLLVLRQTRQTALRGRQRCRVITPVAQCIPLQFPPMFPPFFVYLPHKTPPGWVRRGPDCEDRASVLPESPLAGKLINRAPFFWSGGVGALGAKRSEPKRNLEVAALDSSGGPHPLPRPPPPPDFLAWSKKEENKKEKHK